MPEQKTYLMTQSIMRQVRSSRPRIFTVLDRQLSVHYFSISPSSILIRLIAAPEKITRPIMINRRNWLRYYKCKILDAVLVIKMLPYLEQE